MEKAFKSQDSNTSVIQSNAVYEVTYKGDHFLVGSNLEYIPLVEPKNTSDWEYTNNGIVTKYIGTDTDVIIPNYINGIRIKKIGTRIFKDKNIKKLNISNGIEEIAYLGFQYGLNELEGDLVIPDSITSLPVEAFQYCGANGKLILGRNLKTIGNYAFRACSNLKGDLIIPDSVEEIGASAFSSCSSLNGTLQIGKNVKNIGNNAFSSCSNLVGDLILPDSVENIGNNAFSGDSSLNGNLYIGNNIKNIGSEAFYNLRNLRGDLVIGKSAETIGGSAFRYCNLINSITFLKNNTAINTNSLPPNAIIKGYTGSTAQQYSNDNGKTFVTIPE